jgi:hypothetical protein
VFIFCHDIDLAIATTEITLQDMVTTLYQALSGQTLTCSAKPLTRSFRFLAVLLYQTPLFYITTTSIPLECCDCSAFPGKMIITWVSVLQCIIIAEL